MISVRDNAQIQAAVLALKVMDRTLKNDINRSTKAVLDPIWKGAVTANASTLRDQRVLAKGARVVGGNPPYAVAATSTKALSGGLIPAEMWGPFEFGSGDRNRTKTYQTHSSRGRSYMVTRHTTRQMPVRNKSGRVVYKALAEVAPRVVELWIKMIVAKTYEAVEGRSRG